MTRMFKQLVESSRKKLSKAAAQTAPQAEPRQAEPRKKPEFEPLESRVLFSGIGNGFNKRSVTFTDAWGDTVLVKLIGPGNFDITLDGGARNAADIQNITINNKANARTVLDVHVTPHRLTLSQTYKGGTNVYGDPNRIIYATTTANQIFTPGFVQIGGIYATTNLRGITLNGADFQTIDVTGNIGLGVIGSGGIKPIPGHPGYTGKMLPGGIAVDIGDTQFRSGLLNDPVQAIGFGNISVSGSVDALTLRGRTDTPSTNNLNGSVSIGGWVGSIDARYSNVLAPVTADSFGSVLVNNILAEVSTTGVLAAGATPLPAGLAAGAINQLNAGSVIASVNVIGALGNADLTGSLIGTIQAASITDFSINGNFTGLLESTASIGNVVINSGTAFTGTIEAGNSTTTANIGTIILSQASTPFSGQVNATGSINSITAGFFSNAAVSAGSSIGHITSNATSATVTSGIVNSVFIAGTTVAGSDLGPITSVASITNSQFEAPAGNIESVTVLQGGISGVVLGGSTATEAASIGNITSNLSIQGTSAIASASIGNVTSIAGFIGGSSNTAQFIKPGTVVTVNLGGTFNINGVIALQGGQPGPKSDVFIAGSIGNITALSDISGNVITATAGNITSITSHEGRIAFDSVTATGNIGPIYANSQDATFAFDSAGNVLISDYSSIKGGTSILGGSYSLAPSASAIDHSSFTAGGTIGPITARASAAAGYFPAGAAATVYIADRAIDTSDFTAGGGIVSVNAYAAGIPYHDLHGKLGSTYFNSLNAAIWDSTFTGGGIGVGNVRAIANGGPAITYSTFHATAGNVGAVYGRSLLSNAILDSNIQADVGNVGIVKGIVRGGAGGGTYSDGIESTKITAGSAPGGTGAIAGVYGRSDINNGLDYVHAAAGTGGIAYITGKSYAGTGAAAIAGLFGGANGMQYSYFNTTGPVGAVTGTSNGNFGIFHTYVHAKTIGAISGMTSGYGAGIAFSGFYALGGAAVTPINGVAPVVGIASITGEATSQIGFSGIFDSTFNANTMGTGNGSIGAVYGLSAGHGSGIRNSHFIAAGVGAGDTAGVGITSVTGRATSGYGGGGIVDSYFYADSARQGTGSLGPIVGTSVGNRGNTGGGDGILGGKFYAGSGITSIYGGALGAYSGSGISGGVFNADDAHQFTSAIGTIQGVSKALAGNGSGITGSVFTAGASIATGAGQFIKGTTTAPLSGSYGIADSQFYANAGLSTETNGAGAIGPVIGTAYVNGAYGGVANVSKHAGIAGSLFVAGGGPESTGTIGNVLGSAKVNGQDGIYAAGILSSNFVAGSSDNAANAVSSIGTVTGYALAQGSSAEAYAVSAFGINHGGFYAATGSGSGVGIGTIGYIKGTAKAESAFGSAFAAGIDHTLVAAGTYGKGSAITTGVYGSGEADGLTKAFARGIDNSNIQVGTLSGGSGSIGAIKAYASSESQGFASAVGLRDSGVWAGYNYGSIASVNATGIANGETGAFAAGILGTSPAVAGSYATNFTGGYTLRTGNGHLATPPVSTIGAIVAKGYAYSNTGNATGFGIFHASIRSGYTNGSITSVVANGKAESYSGNATASGIYESNIKAGYGINGVGTIGAKGGAAVSASGIASSYTGNAYASGIGKAAIDIGFNVGHIYGSVTGTGTATVTGKAKGAAKAYAYGIYDASIQAGFDGTYGYIASVTGVAKATVASAAAPTAGTAYAYATGIYNTTIGAAALKGAAVAPDHEVGTIGTVSGIGIAKAYGLNAYAGGAGIYNSSITAADGDFSTGKIAYVYGYGHAIATVNTSNKSAAHAYAYGIGKTTIAAGTGYNSYGKIGGAAVNAVYGKAVATATADGNAADTAISKARGISLGTTISAGYSATSQNSTGIIGNVTGYGHARSFGGTATATAGGISTTTISAGTSQSASTPGTYNGQIGNVTGTAIAYAESSYATATATAYGIRGVTIQAANGALGNGEIGAVLGSGNAQAVGFGLGGNATAHAYGIDPSFIYAGSDLPTTAVSAEAGIGKVASITGKGYAYATTYGAFTTGKTYGYGIYGLTVRLGEAGTAAHPGTPSAVAGTGQVTGGIAGDAKAYTLVPTSGYGYATATGDRNVYVHLSDAYGVSYAKGQNGSLIGGLSAKAYATVNSAATPADKATVKTYGFNNVGIYVSNATAANAKAGAISDIARAGNGTIGGISQTQKAYAYAGGPAGIAKATATPISSLKLYAANAYGYLAYAGIGTVAKGSSIYGHAIAKATGYYAKATATGLSKLYVTAGDAGKPAGGSTYSNAYFKAGNPPAAESYIGPVIGKAYALASATTTKGNREAYAYAYGVKTAVLNAADAFGIKYAHGGYGVVNSVYGEAEAKGYAESSFNGTGKATAYGLKGITANAGNATTTGAGPAKPDRGIIGNGLNQITGLAYAYSIGNKAALGLNGYAKSLATGIYNAVLTAATARATSASGAAYAKANNAYGHVYSVIGKGYGHAYAYGRVDPEAKATGNGIIKAYAYAADAYSVGGPAAAGGAGAGSTGSGVVDGFLGYGLGLAVAKGVAQVKAYGYATGIATIKGSAANATSTGNNAYGGKGYEGLVEGNYGRAVAHGYAYASPISTATVALQTESKGFAYGAKGVTLTAGDGVSTSVTATIAKGGPGEVGALTGLAYGDSYSGGVNGTAASKAYGANLITARAGYAYSKAGNATAGTGNIAANGSGYVGGPGGPGLGLVAGAVYGKGIALANATDTDGLGTTVASAYGYGLGSKATPAVTLSAGTAIAPGAGVTATGNSGTIGNITGTGSADAYATTAKNGGLPTTAGSAKAYSSGIKDAYAYAGDAKATGVGSTAISGVGIIGAITGTGTAKATGFAATSHSFGIDPSKFYAGYAIVANGGGSTGVATGVAGSNSTIGTVTGTAHSYATAYKAVLPGVGVAGAYAYGVKAVTLSAGSAKGGIAAGGKATAGGGTIASGGIIGNAKAHAVGGKTETATADGIASLKANAGGASGYLATAGSDSTGVDSIGAVGGIVGNGKAYANLTAIPTVSATAHGYGILQPAGFYVQAGSALGTAGAKSVATAKAGTLGAINGGGYAYTIAANAAGVATSISYGIKGSTVAAFSAGTAAGHTANGAVGIIGAVTGNAKSTAAGFQAVAKSKGIDPIGLYAGSAFILGSTVGAAQTAAQGTIAAITGTGYSKATGVSTAATGFGHAYSYGIASVKAYAGYARGEAAVGGAQSSIAALTGSATAKAYGYTAVSKAYGISGVTELFAGVATDLGAGSGADIVKAASGYIGKAGAGAYGVSGTALALSNTGNKGTAKAHAFGISGVPLLYAGDARSSGAAGNKAYGAYGYVGNIKGTGSATVTLSAGAATNEYAYGGGIANLTAAVGNATGAYAKSGKGTIGNSSAGKGIVGLGTANAKAGAATTKASAKAYGILIANLKAANAYGTTQAFVGGPGSIANALGKGYGYAYGNAGSKTSVAYVLGLGTAGLVERAGTAAATAGLVAGDTADARLTAGLSDSIGTQKGYAKAYAIGYAAKAGAVGLAVSHAYAGYAKTASGKAYAGKAYVAKTAGGTNGLYGKAEAKALSTGVALAAGAQTTTASAIGVTADYIKVSNATTVGTAKADGAYGAYGYAGNMGGVAGATAITYKGVSEYATAKGIYSGAGLLGVQERVGNTYGYYATGYTTKPVVIGSLTGSAVAVAGKSGAVGAVYVTGKSYGKAYGVFGTGAAHLKLIANYAHSLTAGASGKATAGSATIGAINGSAVAKSYATTTAATGIAVSLADGISNITEVAAKAIGTTAASGVGIVGALIGSAKAYATGFTATATANGIDPVAIYAGYSLSTTGSALAGNGFVGKTGANNHGIYGYAKAVASSPQTAAAAGAEASKANAYGVNGLTIIAGFAHSTGSTAAGNAVTSGYAYVGNIGGEAKAEANTLKGTSQNAYAYGVKALVIKAAYAYDNAGAGTTPVNINATGGKVLTITGYAHAYYTAGTPANPVPGATKGYAIGIDNANAKVSWAKNGLGTNAAVTSGPAYIGAIDGTGLGDAFGAGTAHAKGYGVDILIENTGYAYSLATTAKAGNSTIHTIYGEGSAKVTGLNSYSTGIGITGTVITASIANGVGAANVGGTVNLGTTAVNGKTGIYGVGYAFDKGLVVAADFGALSNGINGLSVTAGTLPAGGGKAGLVTIGNIYGGAESYGYGTAVATNVGAYGYGIQHLQVNAGAGQGANPLSKIGTGSGKNGIYGIATAFNSAPHAAVSVGGADRANGIYSSAQHGVYVYSAGSITGITGKAKGIFTSFLVGAANDTSNGIFSTKALVTAGSATQQFLTFTAGTVIGNIDGETTSTHAGSQGIANTGFRAANAGGSGTTLAIGNVTAVTGSTGAASANDGINNSIFTTTGSIGNVNVTGSIAAVSSGTGGAGSAYADGFFAGIDLGSNFFWNFGADAHASGASIGTGTGANQGVHVSGYFSGADLIASVGSTNNGHWSGSDATSVYAPVGYGGGVITALNIGKGAPATTFPSINYYSHAIETSNGDTSLNGGNSFNWGSKVVTDKVATTPVTVYTGTPTTTGYVVVNVFI